MNSLKFEGILDLNLHSTGMNELDSNFPLQSPQNVPGCLSSARNTCAVFLPGRFCGQWTLPLRWADINWNLSCLPAPLISSLQGNVKKWGPPPPLESYKYTHKKIILVSIYCNIFLISITCKNVAIWKNVKSESHLQAIRFNWTADLYFKQSVYNVLTHLSKIFLPAKH